MRSTPDYIPSLQIPTLGSQELSTEDIDFIDSRKSLSDAINGALLGKRNPFWNDEAELANMRSLGYTMPMTSFNGQINDRIARRFPLSDLNNPRDSISVLQTAIRYYYENPFVAKAVRDKSGFIVDGFQHKTHNSTVKNFYDSECDRLGMVMKLNNIVKALVGVGIVPIWWGGEETKTVEHIEVLDPRMCHIEYNYGSPILFLKIDDKMKAAVADPEGVLDIRNRLRFQSMPRYWVAQIQDQTRQNPLAQQGFIQLAPGSYTVIENRTSAWNRSANALDGLPLQPIFESLQRYRLLSAADFATAWNLKNMITLISEGDPKLTGAKEWVPISSARLANLQATFQRADTNFVAYVDPTTKVEFVIPPVDKIFGVQKYAQTEKEIKENLNLPSFMWVSETGGNYADSMAQLILLRMEVHYVREILWHQFFHPLYTRLRQGKSRPGFQQSDIPRPWFSTHNLQDATLWFQTAKDAYGVGAVSLETLDEVYGLNFEYEMAQKKLEQARLEQADPVTGQPDTIARPLFNPSTGQSTGPKPQTPAEPKPDVGVGAGNQNPLRDRGGNPGKNETQNGPSAGPRNPRPSA